MENNLYIYRKSIFQYQDNNCIIEIKNPVDQNIEIRDIINKLNLRVQRNSNILMAWNSKSYITYNFITNILY